MKRFLVFLLVVLSISCVSCEFFAFMTNSRPTISSVDVVTSMEYGSTTTITVNASDSDDDEITYTYTANRGTFSESSNTTGVVTYTAPEYDALLGTSVTITVTAKDEYEDASDDGRRTFTIDLYRVNKLAIDISKNVFDTLGINMIWVRLNNDSDTDTKILKTELPSGGEVETFYVDFPYSDTLSSIWISSYADATETDINNYDHFDYYNTLSDSNLWYDTGYTPASFSAIAYIALRVVGDVSVNNAIGITCKDPAGLE